MSGERGRRVEFWLSIAASPSFPSGPLSLPNLAGLDCERTNERPQSNYMRRLPTRSRFLPVLYYESDITRPRPFVSHKPTPTSITTYLCLFSFLPNLLPVFYSTLRPTTLYYPLPTFLCAFPCTSTFL